MSALLQRGSRRRSPAGRAVALLVLTLGMLLTNGSAAPVITLAASAPAYPPDTWMPMAAAAAPSPRYQASAVWTGRQMVIWGGWGYQGPPGNPSAAFGQFQDGGVYDLATDRWAPIPRQGAPDIRAGQVAVWTGMDMLIWGGQFDVNGRPPGVDGGRYSSSTRQWLPMTQALAPSTRSGEAAVWTGKELIIWGGSDPNTGALGDGARYAPATDTWVALPSAGAPSASAAPIAVWTGKELLVWGGACSTIYPAGKPPTPCIDAARYDPATNTWSPMHSGPSGVVGGGAAAVWTGTKLLVWGGFQGTILGESAIGGRGFLNGGLLYDPVADAWSTLPQRNPPAGRSDAVAFWTGDQLVVWGGWGGTYGRRPLGDGARYDPSTGTWTPLPDAGAPSSRIGASAVWTGSQLLAWGGSYGDIVPAVAGDGARYTPPGVSAAAPSPHDARFFPQTGFRIDDDTFWDYFLRRGGVSTFGFPRSRTFVFLGLPTQLFQRRILQRFPDGSVHLYNLLDPGVLPSTEYTALAQAPVDPATLRLAPPPASADYAPAVLAFVRVHAPDTLGGAPVDFYQTFLHTVSVQDAFPAGGGDPSLLPLLDLEIWGLPLGSPVSDPNNYNFAYLRWQRGIMHFDARCHCTQSALVADELRGLLTGPDPDAWPNGTGSASRFFRQYDPRRPRWVRDPATLPATDLTNAFTPE